MCHPRHPLPKILSPKSYVIFLKHYLNRTIEHFLSFYSNACAINRAQNAGMERSYSATSTSWQREEKGIEKEKGLRHGRWLDTGQHQFEKRTCHLGESLAKIPMQFLQKKRPIQLMLSLLNLVLLVSGDKIMPRTNEQRILGEISCASTQIKGENS